MATKAGTKTGDEPTRIKDGVGRGGKEKVVERIRSRRAGSLAKMEGLSSAFKKHTRGKKNENQEKKNEKVGGEEKSNGLPSKSASRDVEDAQRRGPRRSLI